MHMTAKTKALLRELLTMDVPEDIYLSTEFPSGFDLSAQCPTQADVRRFRTLFPGTVWTKHYDGNGWSYTGTAPNGWRIYIYAVHEAPPTCRAIEEEYEVEERVPVEFETRLVKKKRLRWDCGNGNGEVSE